MDDGQATEQELQGTGQLSVLASVSREMVRLYKEQFGRGPTKVRTSSAGPDTLVCTLENTFTPADRILVKRGEAPQIGEMRMACQFATVLEFCEPVERLTG